MNSMWMLASVGSHSPSPARSPARPISPMKRAQSERAVRTSVASTTPERSIRTLTGRRASIGSWARAAGSVPVMCAWRVYRAG